MRIHGNDIHRRAVNTYKPLIEFVNNQGKKIILTSALGKYYIYFGHEKDDLSEMGCSELHKFYFTTKNNKRLHGIPKFKSRKASYKEASKIFMEISHNLENTNFSKKEIL